ncbi:B3 domain-containing protein [Hordeum vulgare]|nr:B3 domain-containing protein [Hordeum vulgare]
MEAEYPQINPLLLCSPGAGKGRRTREGSSCCCPWISTRRRCGRSSRRCLGFRYVSPLPRPAILGVSWENSWRRDGRAKWANRLLPKQSSAGGEDAESGKMSESNSYEEQRQRQIEENRRKVEELHLYHLSAAVREAAARPKPKHKPRSPRPRAPASSGGPAASPPYLAGKKRRDYRGGYEAHAAAKQKAEELQRRIHDIRWPAFVKPITHDCAIKSFTMAIPKDFIKYLPAHDEAVVVMDEADD